MNISKLTGVVLLLVFLVSCMEDDYLLRAPLDRISDEDYWKTPSDLEMYVNQFYGMFPNFPGFSAGYLEVDNNSDNMHRSQYDTRLNGELTVNSGNNNWNFNRLRDINIMLDNYHRVDAPESAVAQYVGEAYFFRAWFYFALLRHYGGVPWVDKPLDTDSEELLAPRDPRNVVADNILADLDTAISLLSPRGQVGSNRVNREAALIFKSRVALFEGTWQKYHQNTDFGVSGSSGQAYLQAAADAGRELIEMGTTAIFNTGDPETDYERLFNSENLDPMSEIVLWRRYDLTQGLSHQLHRRMRHGNNTGLSRSLVESFLCQDGLPIALSPLYEGDRSLEDVVANRDRRLRQILLLPGDPLQIENDQVVQVFSRPSVHQSGEERNTTGYQLRKGLDPYTPVDPNAGQTGLPIFRYAEALLNFAEAKAELGTLTQSDVDASINELRLRAGVAPLDLASIANDPNWDFPALSPVINEVRRERRVELAVEGHRFDDLRRWRAHELVVGQRIKGAWFDQAVFPELTPGGNVHLDADGYIDHLLPGLPAGFNFNPDRDYLIAVPPDQITLNPNLTQNPGWD